LRLLVRNEPRQPLNATDDRQTVAPRGGVSGPDRHVNGHTNHAFHLDPDNRPQMACFRIETRTLRGVNVQRRFRLQAVAALGRGRRRNRAADTVQGPDDPRRP
jgi:hypothetical protein